MTDKLQRRGNLKSRIVTAAFAWALSLTPALWAVPSAEAQTFKLLYAFTGGADGGAPWGTPLLTGGILYTPALYGGGPSSAQAGTVFQFEPFPTTGVGYPLYTFLGPPYDGAAPMGGVITDGFGDFFGTTTQGGFSLYGTIYEISQGTEFVVYNFNGSDGDTPEGNLLMDPLGNLYGTTSLGGANDSGLLFFFSAGGSLVPLYSFGNYKGDGIGPASGLVLHKGSVYGVTTEGGKYGWGTVFGVDVRTKVASVLYNFQGKRDGGTPVGGLALDTQGNLYGTASVGGNARHNAGDGVIFKLNIESLQYSVLHRFTGPDGADPLAALVSDGQDNFYGTTYTGGANGYGTVFQLNAAGTLTTLYSFTNGTDGAYPYAGVTLDSSGNLYGAATRGGQYGWGTLFEITP
jgi:uncharacterized repeat protein (TIGR03803 family)